ncbi:hypothetical protein, partial [Pseudomonas syringae group genomosp. 7]|uniref:hypothetical protein n=1 Tax=Pseudomonas syringae group genomosp. 7 TaxID=251699 RepID=UPI003770478B
MFVGGCWGWLWGCGGGGWVVVLGVVGVVVVGGLGVDGEGERYGISVVGGFVGRGGWGVVVVGFVGVWVFWGSGVVFSLLWVGGCWGLGGCVGFGVLAWVVGWLVAVGFDVVVRADGAGIVVARGLVLDLF